MESLQKNLEELEEEKARLNVDLSRCTTKLEELKSCIEKELSSALGVELKVK